MSKRSFVLYNPRTAEPVTYRTSKAIYLTEKTGRQPRDAALKFAREGYQDIWIRERGTKTVHNYKGKKFIRPLTEKQEEYREKYPERIKLRVGKDENGQKVQGLLVSRVKKMKPGTYKFEDFKKMKLGKGAPKVKKYTPTKSTVKPVDEDHVKRTQEWASAFAKKAKEAKEAKKAKKATAKGEPTRRSARKAAQK